MGGRDRRKEGRRLVRVRRGRLVAGVCAGIGVWLDWNPWLVRVLWVVLPVANFLSYIVLWLVLPLADE